MSDSVELRWLEDRDNFLDPILQYRVREEARTYYDGETCDGRPIYDTVEGGWSDWKTVEKVYK